jgi:hypothetical protein
MSHSRVATRTSVALLLLMLAAALLAPTRADATRLPALDPELAEARRLLDAQIEAHPILEGTTIEFGKVGGYQAISMYEEGRIIVNPDHRARLERIVAHEVWHVIDWRDNHRMDWGENIPPR